MAAQPTFAVGDIVWFKRLEKSGTKLDSRWIGPSKVVNARGANSYEIQVKENLVMDVNPGALPSP